MDLECCACWESDEIDNPCPAVRLMMKNNDYLSMERGKILAPTFDQREVAFPRNEWVNVKWQMRLAPNEDGLNQLWINGQEVLSEVGMNMPNADLFMSFS